MTDPARRRLLWDVDRTLLVGGGVGVATGPATAAEPTAAGAHHVLADLADVAATVALLAG